MMPTQAAHHRAWPAKAAMQVRPGRGSQRQLASGRCRRLLPFTAHSPRRHNSWTRPSTVSENAHAHLQELSAAGKVPSSLCVELSSVALALLPKVPGALEELVALEKLFMEAEIAKLQREAAQDGAALQDILTGDAFVSACRQAMEFDSLSAKTQATLLPLITEAEEDFKLDMEFAQVDLQEHATKEEAAPTKTELAWTAGRARKKAHKSRKTMV